MIRHLPDAAVAAGLTMIGSGVYVTFGTVATVVYTGICFVVVGIIAAFCFRNIELDKEPGP